MIPSSNFTTTLITAIATLIQISAAVEPAWALERNQQYDAQLLQRALRAKRLARHPNPAGKRIAGIVIYREDIVGTEDPWPDLVNIVHHKSKDFVVRQELLFRVGESYKPSAIIESERNLRNMSVLAVARIVACKATRTDSVVVLVATKDIWSARFNMTYSQTGNLVTTFDLNPTENNLWGRNKELGLHIGAKWLELHTAAPFPLTLFSIGRVVRDHISFGGVYLDRRLLGTRFKFLQQFKVQLDGHVPAGGAIRNETNPNPQLWRPSDGVGSMSGVYARARLERPLFSLKTDWSFYIDGWIDTRPVRVFRQNPTDPNSGLRQPGERPGVSLDAVAFDAHPDGNLRYVPHVYDQEQRAITFGITRSIGSSLKHDLGVGWSAYSDIHTVPKGFPFDTYTRRWFVDAVLPRSEAAIALNFNYALRPTHYVQLKNVRTFALSEDYALGPRLTVQASFAQNLLDQQAPFVALSIGGQYWWLISDHLFALRTAATTRHQSKATSATGVDADSHWVNSRLDAALYYATPCLGPGRLHLFSGVVLRKHNLDRNYSRLGGAGDSDSSAPLEASEDTALRGYLAGQFIGRNLWHVHAEYRSKPLILWTVHFGGVLFYDAGSAWGRPGPGQIDTRFSYRQSAGFGIRLLVPQFDREGMRVDFGFPFGSGATGKFDTWFAFSFGQTF